MATTQRFIAVPETVEARRLFVDERLPIKGRWTNCPAGMWVVTTESRAGKVNFLYPDDRFREHWRPTDAASEAMWNEQTKKIYPQWPDGRPVPLN